jgi:RNA polymerase sigma-70 factor (ECF subfamily)
MLAPESHDRNLLVESAPSEEFVRELTGCQARLLSFVMTLLPDQEAAQEVVQNTNVVLWRKASDFTPGTNFLAWAFQIARHEVRAYLRDCARDRLVFDIPLVEEMATSAQAHIENASKLAIYLDECLSLRTAEERALLQARYAMGGSVKEMAKQQGRTPNHLSLMLCRIRQKLASCVGRKLAREEQQ